MKPRFGSEDYEQIFAVDRADWNICYYCGDIAAARDYIPPIAVADCFESSRDLSDFITVPCCKECGSLGGNEPHARLGERADYIRNYLAKKYVNEWKKTQLWGDSEVSNLIESEGETSITRSLQAIVDSESDLTSRLRFRGYPFEVRGSTYNVGETPIHKYSVFGAKFDTFKEALDHSAKAYRVKPEVLFEYARQFGGNIEDALNQVFRDQEKLSLEKELKAVARKLAKIHRKPKDWVFRALMELQKSDPDSSIEEISKRLVDKYIVAKK